MNPLLPLSLHTKLPVAREKCGAAKIALIIESTSPPSGAALPPYCSSCLTEGEELLNSRAGRLTLR
jgi:hypothetical protein